MEMTSEGKRRFTANILMLLEKRGLTEKQLAELSGISRVTISYYCNGHNYPKENNLKKLAKALEVEPAELTGESVISVEQENKFLKCFREMRKIYPTETLLIISPSTYKGFNLATGKKMCLRVEEVDWK